MRKTNRAKRVKQTDRREKNKPTAGSKKSARAPYFAERNIIGLMRQSRDVNRSAARIIQPRALLHKNRLCKVREHARKIKAAISCKTIGD